MSYAGFVLKVRDMRKAKVRTIAAILVFLLVVSGYGAYRWFMKELVKSKFGAPSAGCIGALISSYISENGHFPKCEDDLVQKGFLKRTETGEGTRYFIRYYGDNKRPWHELNFDSFKILYGVCPERYAVVDGKLCDKLTNEQVLLIDGPYKEDLKAQYESISLWWYELMLGEDHPPEEGTEIVK